MNSLPSVNVLLDVSVLTSLPHPIHPHIVTCAVCLSYGILSCWLVFILPCLFYLSCDIHPSPCHHSSCTILEIHSIVIYLSPVLPPSNQFMYSNLASYYFLSNPFTVYHPVYPGLYTYSHTKSFHVNSLLNVAYYVQHLKCPWILLFAVSCSCS